MWSYNRTVPANLTHAYLEAEQKFKSASGNPEKVAALEEMLRTIPKHKGTEKMQADIKRRLSQQRKEAQKKKPKASQKPFHYVEKEGAGQVVLCGPPNSGKSQLLKNLTRAEPKVAQYPFTTQKPLPGMLPYQDIRIQLVDTPPLAPEILEPWQLVMIQQADAGLLLFDVNDPNLLVQTDFVLAAFGDRQIVFDGSQGPPLFVLGNKIDDPQGKENFSAWQELYQENFQAEPFSALSEEDLGKIPKLLFDALEIVRVYTKAPGEKPEAHPTPYVLKQGSTIFDVALTVHRELAQNFKFARVWGKAKFDGQMVERSYLVEDGDLVEIHW